MGIRNRKRRQNKGSDVVSSARPSLLRFEDNGGNVVKEVFSKEKTMNHPTEEQVRTAEGKQLNELVERYCYGDDLSCFNPDGTERIERIIWACHAKLSMNERCNWYCAGCSLFGRFGCYQDAAKYAWSNRQDKTYQSDLEARVNKYRVTARDFEGDMNLVMELWRDEFECLERIGDTWFVPVVGDFSESCFGTEKPAQAICCAAVILKLREVNTQ